MTIRLKSLTLTAEQKDSELNELRKTIELLKKQNAVAQAAINGVINTPELTPKGDRTAGNNSSSQQQQQNQQPDLRIRRQHSSDSVSSVASATSHSSVGSNMDTVLFVSSVFHLQLRSSFKQAFSKKKSPKSASSHSDIEEMTDSSLPSSPKLPHNGTTASSHMLRNTHSNSLEAETVMQLRSELREKEMKLTDIRLEALSSAHQLDQLREAMNRMQVLLCLPVRHAARRHWRRGRDEEGRATCEDGRQPEGLSVSKTSRDFASQEGRPRHFLIGCIGVSGKTKWDVLDGVVRRPRGPGEPAGAELRQRGGIQYRRNPPAQHSQCSPHTRAAALRLPVRFGRAVQRCPGGRQPSGGHSGQPAPRQLPGRHLQWRLQLQLPALRRKLIETEIGSRTRNMELVKIIDWIPRVWHHLNRFLSALWHAGPRLFLSCPMDVEGSRVWFTDLWNYSIIPYMLEAIREGPWSATPTPAEWPPLLQLRPEDVGFDGYSAPREGVRKEPPQSDSDADPHHQPSAS